MGAAIGQSLPIAVGVLISPMPIVAMVLMLVSRRAKVNGTAFLLGWLVGIYVVGAIVVLLAGASGADDTSDPPTWASWVKIVLGVLLLLLALRTWQGRPRGDAVPAAPKWMSAIDSIAAVKSFGLAFLLGAINPKNLLLVVSGAAAIATATSSTSTQLVALVVFTVVASIGVAAPLVVYVAMGERAAKILADVQTWMITHNAAIMSVLLLVLGTKMLGDGISHL